MKSTNKVDDIGIMKIPIGMQLPHALARHSLFFRYVGEKRLCLQKGVGGV